jgi:predicted lipid-binding transport protein (Tim44 family)
VGVLSRTQDDGANAEGIETAARLHERVDESFGPIWRAQENRDADLMRPYVSQAYLERSEQAFDALDRAAQMHRIEDDELRDVAVARPENDTFAGSAQVYLLFSVRHSTIDLRTGQVVSGDAAPRAWTACWTFVLEPKRGWVVDRLAAVWRARDKRKPAPGKWPGLPAGTYSHRDQPWEWEQWDGAAWSGADQALVT